MDRSNEAPVLYADGGTMWDQEYWKERVFTTPREKLTSEIAGRLQRPDYSPQTAAIKSKLVVGA